MPWTRRDVIRLANSALLGGVLSRTKVVALTQSANARGFVIGQPDAARVGIDVLTEGGNAIDAAVAAALAAGTVALGACGIGGYGGHMMIARPRGKVTAIDFNSAAPLAARADMFTLDANGAVKDEANTYGWLAAGVPGTLAGLQLAIDRYGTRPFRTLVQPAIRLAREGFPLRQGQVNIIKTASPQLQKDPASARLLLKDGEPPQPGTTYHNPDLAAMLETLADAGSVAPFYRGAIARAIAAAFRKNGGLVTEKDLSEYRAREVTPLEFSWHGYSVRTAPLTAGGATVVQALAILRALGWERLEAESTRDLHVRLEALRIAWDDRLRLLGDPQHVDVPLRRLLSTPYAEERAAQVDNAVRNGTRVAVESSGGADGGTVHLSAGDRDGNVVALTLTHGNPFGARVTVDGLGLILGHGMARFDPRPGRPNSPGPGKRPLHNMCPTVVLKKDVPVLALGGAGFRMIPNAVFEVLARCVGRDAPLEQAIAAPRVGTDGGTAITLDAAGSATDAAFLEKLGYTVTRAPVATVSAVAVERTTRNTRGASR